MSNVSDLLNNIEFAQNGATALAGNILGSLADVGGAVQAVVSIISLFINKDQEILTKLSDLQTEIRKNFAALNAELRAEHILNRLNSLDPALAQAQAVIDQLKDDLSKTPPVDEEYRLQQIGLCLYAVEQLNQDDKWLTNFSDEIYYGSNRSDWWSGPLSPKANADGTVFSDRYILPDFLRVLYDFMLVAAAFEPGYAARYQVSLKSFTARLQKAYDTSKGGIVTMRKPTAAQIGIIGGGYNVSYNFGYSWPYLDGEIVGQTGKEPGGANSAWHSPFCYSTFTLVGDCADILSNITPDAYYVQVYGVAHTYSGYSNVSNYPAIPKPAVKPEVFWPRFSASLNLVIRRNWKEAYAAVGLATVWSTINVLRSLTGDQPLGPFDPEVEWTLREIGNILGSAFRDSSKPAPAGISAEAVISGLTAIAASMREGKDGVLPAPPVKRPLSLRGALNAAMKATTFSCVPGAPAPPINLQ
jgi:hypothetical protein